MSIKQLLTKTILVAAGLCVGASAWGESQLFSEDFESAATPTAAGWTITGGTGTVEPDGAAGIGKYAKFVPAGTKGNRGQSYGFSAANITSAANCWKIEFDAAFTSGGDRTENSIAITSSTTGDITTNNAASGNFYFRCKQNANGSQNYDIVIGNSADAASAQYTLTAGSFYHFIIMYDGTKVIAKVGDNATVSKAVSSATVGALKGLKTCESRGAGVVSIDNIKLYSLTAPAFTLSEDSKTVAVAGSETVSVTGITGSVSVTSNNPSVATASYTAGTITINGVADGVTRIVVTATNDGLTVEKEIEVTVGSVATTDITVNYLCGGSPIADALVLNDVAVGSTLTAGDITYNAVVAGTGCRYVNPEFSPALPYVVEEDGVININYTRQDAVAALAVKAKIGSSTYDIKSIDLDSKYVGDAVAFNYPRYFLDGTTLYETSQDAHGDGYYKWNYTLEGNTVNIEYNTTVSTNVVYYAEGESITGMEVGSSSNSDIRCSDGKGGYFTTADDPITLKNLEAGRYRVMSFAWGSAGTTYTFKAGGNTVSTLATTGSLNESSSIFVLNAAADLTLEASNNSSSQVFDCVYVEKYDTDNNIVYNGDFSNATWNKGWKGTGTDKKKAFVTNTNAWFTGQFAEMWAGSGSTFSNDADLYQTITNVPAGTYVLSSNIVNSALAGTGVLYAKVGDATDVTTDATNLAVVTAKSVTFTVSTPSTVRIGFKTTGISGSTGWLAVDDFKLIQVVPVTVGATGFATYSNANYALDFTGLGVKAYKATLTGENTVLLSPVTTVPANTGLFLKGAPDTYNVPVIASASAVEGNLLKPSADAEIAASDGGTYHYVLANGSNGVGFYNLAAAKNIGAGKAYLETTTALATSSTARVSIVFEDEETTGISAVNGSGLKVNGSEGFYNLNGQRVAAPQKGLYIVNGKKVIVK